MLTMDDIGVVDDHDLGDLMKVELGDTLKMGDFHSSPEDLDFDLSDFEDMGGADMFGPPHPGEACPMGDSDSWADTNDHLLEAAGLFDTTKDQGVLVDPSSMIPVSSFQPAPTTVSHSKQNQTPPQISLLPLPSSATIIPQQRIVQRGIPFPVPGVPILKGHTLVTSNGTHYATPTSLLQSGDYVPQPPVQVNNVSSGTSSHKSRRQTAPRQTAFISASGKVYPKPAYSYSCLIAMALKNSPTGCLPVSDIYNFMCQQFPYFRTAPNGWKNSVRHNLSLNKCFEKVEKPANGARKGCLWALNPAKVHKMEEEVAKWSKKDPAGIQQAMAFPDYLRKLERGEMKLDDEIAAAVSSITTISPSATSSASLTPRSSCQGSDLDSEPESEEGERLSSSQSVTSSTLTHAGDEEEDAQRAHNRFEMEVLNEKYPPRGHFHRPELPQHHHHHQDHQHFTRRPQHQQATTVRFTQLLPPQTSASSGLHHLQAHQQRQQQAQMQSWTPHHSATSTSTSTTIVGDLQVIPPSALVDSTGRHIENFLYSPNNNAEKLDGILLNGNSISMLST
ncbi:unnamed protein product [Cyprideis torosa]|uniref:Uncharacterized protein n=1 Tax=Cyprideis torosa TaxID=163714 RepID=A0A7R8WDR3_9CRUS|nr:unnamed protein product [Cyprideis torosa]CAG0894901.1 unnamed protein product [Cyprideis torosa]